MKTFWGALLCLVATSPLASAKHPSHEISAEVESVSISENKILVVLNGTIQLAMFSGQSQNGCERPLTVLYHVPLTLLRGGGTEAEAHWTEYSAFFKEAATKKVSFSAPKPSYVFERDRITSMTADLIYLKKEKSPPSEP